MSRGLRRATDLTQSGQFPASLTPSGVTNLSSGRHKLLAKSKRAAVQARLVGLQGRPQTSAGLGSHGPSALVGAAVKIQATVLACLEAQPSPRTQESAASTPSPWRAVPMQREGDHAKHRAAGDTTLTTCDLLHLEPTCETTDCHSTPLLHVSFHPGRHASFQGLHGHMWPGAPPVAWLQWVPERAALLPRGCHAPASSGRGRAAHTTASSGVGSGVACPSLAPGTTGGLRMGHKR